MHLLPALTAATILLLAGLSAARLEAADSTRCADKVRAHLEELPLAEGEIKSVRIIEQVNIAGDFGPEILGVEAWVRLNSCSSWLVINMTAKCFIRQSYTRDDCHVEGLSNY